MEAFSLHIITCNTQCVGHCTIPVSIDIHCNPCHLEKIDEDLQDRDRIPSPSIAKDMINHQVTSTAMMPVLDGVTFATGW